MLPDKIKELFKGADRATKIVILRVLELEDAHLSKERPRIVQDIRDIVEEEARRVEA